MAKKGQEKSDIEDSQAKPEVIVDVADEKSEIEVQDADNQENDSPEEHTEHTLQEEFDLLNDKYLRLLAEFDNFKRRTAKERIELRKTAAQDVISDLLTVLDDFNRASKILEEKPESNVDKDGFILIANKLKSILQSKGLRVMDSLKADFDPELHEAITEIPAADKQLKGKVVDVIEEGYVLGEKIIRHARVVVGK